MSENDDAKKLTKEDEEILSQLKQAYSSIKNLSETPTHKKISLELEQKIRKLKKSESK